MNGTIPLHPVGAHGMYGNSFTFFLVRNKEIYSVLWHAFYSRLTGFWATVDSV